MSLDNIRTDLKEMEKNMDITRREFEERKSRDKGHSPVPAILQDFLANWQDKLRKLAADFKTADVGFCVWSQVS